MEEERLKQEKRGNILYDLQQVEEVVQPGEELSSINLYRLMLVYERVSKRWLTRTEPVKHTVVQYPYTIEKQKQAIAELLGINKRLEFATISKISENKVHFVYNFLALLEMLQQQLVNIQIGTGYNNFWVSALDNTELN
jgi:segregation and condensation protein A